MMDREGESVSDVLDVSNIFFERESVCADAEREKKRKEKGIYGEREAAHTTQKTDISSRRMHIAHESPPSFLQHTEHIFPSKQVGFASLKTPP